MLDGLPPGINCKPWRFLGFFALFLGLFKKEVVFFFLTKLLLYPFSQNSFYRKYMCVYIYMLLYHEIDDKTVCKTVTKRLK